MQTRIHPLQRIVLIAQCDDRKSVGPDLKRTLNPAVDRVRGGSVCVVKVGQAVRCNLEKQSEFVEF